MVNRTLLEAVKFLSGKKAAGAEFLAEGGGQFAMFLFEIKLIKTNMATENLHFQ